MVRLLSCLVFVLLMVCSACAQTIKSFSLAREQILGGYSDYGTVKLTKAAGPNGLALSLDYDHQLISFNGPLTVPAGQSSFTINFGTFGVIANQSTNLTVSDGTTSKSATLTILAPWPVSLTTTPSASVVGGLPLTLKVTLNTGPVTNGYLVSLHSSSPSIHVPDTLSCSTIETSLTVNTDRVSSDEVVTLTATSQNVTVTKTITVKALTADWTLSSSSTNWVFSGLTIPVRITTNVKAGGYTFHLSSSDPRVIVPSTVTIGNDQAFADFQIKTTASSSTYPAKISVQGWFDADFTVRGIGLNTASPWPCFRHDAGNMAKGVLSNAKGIPATDVPFETSETFSGVTPAIGPDGTVYVCSTAGTLYALNPDLSLKWSRSGVSTGSPAIGQDGSIFVGGEIVSPDGDVVLSYFGAQSPILGDDGTIYSSGYPYLLVSGVDGREKWHGYLKTDGSPAKGPDGTVYQFGVRDFDDDLGDHPQLFAMGPTGAMLWRMAFSFCKNSMPVVGPDGNIYCAGTDYLLSITPKPLLNFKVPLPHSEVGGPPAIGPDGTIYVTRGGDTNLYAFRPNGKLKWKFGVGGGIAAAPVVSSNGHIYFPSTDGNLYAVRSNGTLIWSIAGSPNATGSFAIGPKGVLYIAFDHKVIALK